MDTQNSKGQAVIEMALVLSIFLIVWIFVQNQIQVQKKQFKKWKVGHETRIEIKAKARGNEKE